MVKEYVVDKEKLTKTINNEYKKHPLWSKRSKVRGVIYAICIILPIILAYNQYNHPEQWSSGTPTILRVLVGFLIGFIFLWIPAIIYVKSLKSTCRGDLIQSQVQSLIIFEDKLQYGYHRSSDSNVNSYNVNEINYSSITSIILNKYHNRLTINGKINSIEYNNYEQNDIWYSKEIEDDGRAKITQYRNREVSNITYEDNLRLSDKCKRFYLYYIDSDDFVQNLCERSKIALEIVDYPEE